MLVQKFKYGCKDAWSSAFTLSIWYHFVVRGECILRAHKFQARVRHIISKCRRGASWTTRLTSQNVNFQI
jgi:hypothetical protein